MSCSDHAFYIPEGLQFKGRDSLEERLSVVIDATFEEFDLLVLDDVHAIANTAEEVLIVRDDHNTALKVVESHDQGINGVEVQVISRLIQKKDVRLGPGNHSEGNATLLSS